MNVTVDYDDLERIVYAASAIKQIEGALVSFRRDPMVQRLGDFIPAQKRLESAMRNAKRAELGTLVNYDEPLTPEESSNLAYIKAACEDRDPPGGLFGLFVISPEDKAEPGRAMSPYDRLAAKGMIEIGQFVQGVVWAGADAAQLTADPKGYAARLTARGRAYLAPKE